MVPKTPTEKLLKRALDFLVDAQEPLAANGKIYKNIKFSYQQIIAAMHELAGPQDIASNALFNTSSTISQNETYKLFIVEAKGRRAEKELSGRISSMPNKNLSDIEYQLTIQNLIFQKDILQEKNIILESLIKRAEIDKSQMDLEPKTNTLENLYEGKTSRVLIELLKATLRNRMTYIKPSSPGTPASIWIEDEDGGRILCNLQDLDSLNLQFEKDYLGILIIKECL